MSKFCDVISDNEKRREHDRGFHNYHKFRYSLGMEVRERREKRKISVAYQVTQWERKVRT